MDQKFEETNNNGTNMELDNDETDIEDKDTKIYSKESEKDDNLGRELDSDETDIKTEETKILYLKESDEDDNMGSNSYEGICILCTSIRNEPLEDITSYRIAIKFIGNVDIQELNWPSKACKECLKMLNITTLFKRQLIRSHITNIKNYVDSNKESKVDEENNSEATTK